MPYIFGWFVNGCDMLPPLQSKKDNTTKWRRDGREVRVMGNRERKEAGEKGRGKKAVSYKNKIKYLIYCLLL